VLVKLSFVEQPRALLKVEAGCSVTEVAERYRVTRQTLHAWMRRYRDGGLAWLGGSVAPAGRVSASNGGGGGALVCELRRPHPR
jgi:transposase-like protein